MRLSSEQQSMRLNQMLESALAKQKAWRPCAYKPSTNQVAEISPESRDETVRWLAQLNKKFRFYPETFALSTSILDRFLHLVKARPKYLKCIGVACFYLAVKTLEEDEVIPETLELVRESECACTISEVMRMERIVLDKLNWSLHTVTSLDFLHIFHALLMAKLPRLLDQFRHMTPSRQLAVLTDKLQKIMTHHRFASFRPAIVALGLVSLELELFTPDWFPATLWLQTMSEVDSQSLIQCRELMSRYLISQHLTVFNTAYLYVANVTPITANKPTKRKVEQIEEDDIYDGIKRLYNEENEPAAVTIASCSLEACQDTSTALPLQAVAN